jgi:hypothetical protein
MLKEIKLVIKTSHKKIKYIEGKVSELGQRLFHFILTFFCLGDVYTLYAVHVCACIEHIFDMICLVV